MNPICTLTAQSLQRRIDESQTKLHLYTSLKKITRVALPLIGLTLLTTFGLLNPRSLPLSSFLLIAAYAPCLEVTIGTLEHWSYEVREEMDKQTRIQEGLSSGKVIFQAWLDAIPLTPIPSVGELEQEVRENPGSEAKRQTLWEGQKERALHRLKNGRRKVERAFIEFVRNHQENKKMLSDYGSYKPWQIEHLMNDLPFTVFVTKDGREFTNDDDCSQIFM